MTPNLDQACRDGLAALDSVLEGKPAPEHDPIAGATRGASLMRDLVIEAQRRGDSSVAHLLERANMLVSELVAGEFPVAGFRRKRIEDARVLYRQVFDEVSRLESPRH
jgi:hypothetical protein